MTSYKTQSIDPGQRRCLVMSLIIQIEEERLGEGSSTMPGTQ